MMESSLMAERDGRLEEWKIGRMVLRNPACRYAGIDEWKNGMMEFPNIPFLHSSPTSLED